MKSKEDLAVQVMLANIPKGALTFPDTAIAYHGDDHGRIHAFRFTSTGKMRYKDAPIQYSATGGQCVELWGELYELPMGFKRRQVAIDLTQDKTKLPENVAKRSGKGRMDRYMRARQAQYVADHHPRNFTHYQEKPGVALRVVGGRVEAWRVSIGKVMGHKFYDGRDGVKITAHPVVNGTAVVDGTLVRVADGQIVAFEGGIESDDVRMPATLATPSHIMDQVFEATTTPEGFRPATGIRAWYRGVWGPAAGGLHQAGIEFAWGDNGQYTHTVPLSPTGEVWVLGLRYSVSTTFELTVL